MNLVLPNVDFKLARNPLHAFGIENSIKVFLSGRKRQASFQGSALLKRMVEEDRRMNLEAVIRDAAWNAEVVKKLGAKWFELRDSWLNEAQERDMEILEESKARCALLKVLAAKSEVERLKEEELERRLKEALKPAPRAYLKPLGPPGA